MALVECSECKGPVSTKAAACPKCGAPIQGSSGGLRLIDWLGLFAMVGLLAIFASTFDTNSRPEQDKPKSDKELAVAKIEFTVVETTRDALNTVLLIDAIIQNNGERPVKDIEVSCASFGSSGTQIDRNRKVIYESLAPRQMKRISRFNMGFVHAQTVRTSCGIADLVAM